MAAITDLHFKRGKVARQRWVEVQRVVAQFHAGVATFQQIDGAGHRAEMDAFRRGAALDVFEVAAQRLGEEPPRSLSVGARQHP